MTVLGSSQAQGVLGREVRSMADENMGRIVDVIVDQRTGARRDHRFRRIPRRRQPQDRGRLERAAVPSGQHQTDVITLELTRDQVKAAPEYKDKQPVVVLGATGGLHHCQPISHNAGGDVWPGMRRHV